VETFERETPTASAEGRGAVATVGQKVWTPPAADGVLAAVFSDTFEVRVLCTDTGPKLVAAIELISPGNKERPAERRAFATKCASYLYQGISVIIVDIVTNRRANLHNEILRVMEAGDILQLPPEASLYAVAYRPLRRGKGDEIDIWRSPLALGQNLPTLPLGLRADLVIPVDFEAAYAEACLRKRLTGS
jgi:predicted nucleic acid-binding protein